MAYRSGNALDSYAGGSSFGSRRETGYADSVSFVALFSASRQVTLHIFVRGRSISSRSRAIHLVRVVYALRAL
jgi:hypothetical protein